MESKRMNLVDIEVRKREREQRLEKKEQSIRTRKMMLVGLAFTVLFTGLMGRIFYIKAVHGEEYEREALRLQYNRNNSESVLNPNRGSIVDRNSQSLAISHTVYNIILDIRALVREERTVQENTVKLLSQYLGEPEYELAELLLTEPDPETGGQRPKTDRSYYVVKREVTRAVKTELMESGVKCVYAEPDTMRDYVHGNLASQIIGFTRGDSKWGLEARYDEEMSGQEGRMVRFYDADNNPVTEQKDPVDGYTVVTTLDTSIQRFAEEAALSAGLEYESRNALVAVMNPMTGELLAMAQYPTFDLNAPSDTELFTNAPVLAKQAAEAAEAQAAGAQAAPAEPAPAPTAENTQDGSGESAPAEGSTSADGGGQEPSAPDPAAEAEAARVQQELDNLYRVWGNYGISTTFEPGSVFKPVIVAAALEEGLISVNDRYTCNGTKTILDTTVPCWIYQDYGTVHGEQTLTQVLANSCNIGLMDIGEKLGREFFYKYQHDFGFGGLTGIDLPGETDTSEKTGLVYPLSGLNPVEIGTGSIGQGFNVTAIQAITAFSAIVNGGQLMKPYVVSQVLDRGGAVISETHPEVVRKVISRETSNYMRDAMRQVVTQEGTGSRAVIEGYAIGGKTGTAQQGEKVGVEDEEHVLSFMAYLPSDNPEIIALALIDRPKEYKEGSTSAAPMLKSVLQKIITYKAIPPGESSEWEAGALLKNSVTVGDYVGGGLADVSKELNAKRVDFECIGNGDRVIRQSPAPGSVSDVGVKVILYLGESGTDAAGGLVLLPDTVNAGIETARNLLEGAGFTVLVDIDSGTVPAAGGAAPADGAGSEAAAASPAPEESPAPGGQSLVTSVYDQIPSGGILIDPRTEIRLKARQQPTS